MKIFPVFLFIACCGLLSASEKVVIERSPDSEIQSITVDEDSLTIKSKGKIYTFEFSELLKDESMQHQKGESVQSSTPAPKNLEEAFKYNGEWCFFNFVPSMRNRLCYLSNPKQSYKVFQKGNLLQRVLYKNKYYARDLNKTIYRPDWEIKADFSPHLVPAKQYLEALDNKIRLENVEIEAIEKKIPMLLALLKSKQRGYKSFMTANNIVIKKIDHKGNVIIQENSGRYSSKIKKELQQLYQEVQEREEEVKNASARLESAKMSLQQMLEFKRKLDTLYQKYAVNGSKDVPKKPVKIYF